MTLIYDRPLFKLEKIRFETLSIGDKFIFANLDLTKSAFNRATNKDGDELMFRPSDMVSIKVQIEPE